MEYPSYRGYLCFTENLAVGTGPFTVTNGITLWTDEAKDYDPNNPQYSHFTQVAWKSTTQLGCAMIDCAAGTIYPNDVRILPPTFTR
jgi:hypothetical protein